VTRLLCSRFIQLDGGAGLREQWGGRRSLGTLSFLAEAVVRVGRSLLAAWGCAGCRGSGGTGSGGHERAGCVGEFARRAMVVARTLDCVCGGRLGARDRAVRCLAGQVGDAGARDRATGLRYCRWREPPGERVLLACDCGCVCVVRCRRSSAGATRSVADRWRVFRGQWRSWGRGCVVGYAIGSSYVGGGAGHGGPAAPSAELDRDRAIYSLNWTPGAVFSLTGCNI
jgi:hypothetical protein